MTKTSNNESVSELVLKSFYTDEDSQKYNSAIQTIRNLAKQDKDLIKVVESYDKVEPIILDLIKKDGNRNSVFKEILKEIKIIFRFLYEKNI